MGESRPYGSVRGALSNERPYRDFSLELTLISLSGSSLFKSLRGPLGPFFLSPPVLPFGLCPPGGRRPRLAPRAEPPLLRRNRQINHACLVKFRRPTASSDRKKPT